MTQVRINRDTVTHIKIYPPNRGPEDYSHPYIKLPATNIRRFFFWNVDFPEGYYSGGTYLQDSSWYPNYFTEEEVKERNAWYIKDNEIWTRAKIVLYIGRLELGVLYFDTFSLAKRYCNKEFPNVEYIDEIR